MIVLPLCESDRCVEVAAYVVHSPGRTLRFCVGCKMRAVGVAEAMGFDLTVEPLPPPPPVEYAPHPDPAESPTPRPKLAAHLAACNPEDGCVEGCPVAERWRP